MNLADMLNYTDIQELGRIARSYNCQCSPHSKNELIQSILSTVGRQCVLDDLVAGMDKADIQFLNSLLFEERNAFSLEDLIARASLSRPEEPEGGGGNPRELVARFKQRGWLFNGYSRETQYLFQVPDDLKKRFADALQRHFERKLVYLEHTPRVYRDEQNRLTEDIRTFLLLLDEASMPVNTEGFLYKKHLQQIIGRLSVSEEPVAKTAWRFGYGRRYREYPIRFSFIYDYCYYQGYLEEQGFEVRLSAAGRELVQSGARISVKELYSFWLRLYREPIPNLQSLAQWLGRLAERWVTAESAAQVICPLVNAYYYDSPRDILESRMLPMMMHLGLLRIGGDADAGAVLQASELGKSIIRGTWVPEEDKLSLDLGS